MHDAQTLTRDPGSKIAFHAVGPKGIEGGRVSGGLGSSMGVIEGQQKYTTRHWISCPHLIAPSFKCGKN